MSDAPEKPERNYRAWAVLIALVALFSLLLHLVHLPSPVLFGSLAAGLVYALVAPRVPEAPAFTFTFAQAVLGASIGSTLQPSTLSGLRDDWLPVLLSCAATLLLSIAAGFVLRLRPGVSTATGVFSMIAGGASGIVAISRDLGADDRVVAVVQYLRVLIILLGMPLIAQIFEPGDQSVQFAVTWGEAASEPPLWAGLAIAAISLLVGLPLARLIRFPAGGLIFPLVIAALLSGTGLIDAAVPTWLENLGFALIGLQVGLRFTRESLRAVAALLPLATATIIGLIIASAGLGALLSWATGRTLLDGYLATTPGGLYAVLATAVAMNSDVAFVLLVQIARLLMILLCAPLLARLLAGRKT